MRIACLQFSPQVGDVDNNLNRADAVLSKADQAQLDGLDLLVLPALAFTGYHFHSLQHISPFLEHSGSGITSLWARTTALKYNTTVAVGYPEKVDVTVDWPASPEYFNSTILVNGDGETIANYRKAFLYSVDETWALEGKDGFFEDELEGLGAVAMGIDMDLNPYKFEAPWHNFEFAFHVIDSRSNLVIITMAWSTREDSRSFTQTPGEPDMETVTYWVQRLDPIIRLDQDKEVIVVFCNRSGIEEGVVYAGTSMVLGIKEGEVCVYGLLGRGVKELLIVDTDNPPFAKLLHRPDDEKAVAEAQDMQPPGLLPDVSRTSVSHPKIDLNGRQETKALPPHPLTTSNGERSRNDTPAPTSASTPIDDSTSPASPMQSPVSARRPRVTIPVTTRATKDNAATPHPDRGRQPGGPPTRGGGSGSAVEKIVETPVSGQTSEKYFWHASHLIPSYTAAPTPATPSFASSLVKMPSSRHTSMAGTEFGSVISEGKEEEGSQRGAKSVSSQLAPRYDAISPQSDMLSRHSIRIGLEGGAGDPTVAPQHDAERSDVPPALRRLRSDSETMEQDTSGKAVKSSEQTMGSNEAPPHPRASSRRGLYRVGEESRHATPFDLSRVDSPMAQNMESSLDRPASNIFKQRGRELDKTRTQVGGGIRSHSTSELMKHQSPDIEPRDNDIIAVEELTAGGRKISFVGAMPFAGSVPLKNITTRSRSSSLETGHHVEHISRRDRSDSVDIGAVPIGDANSEFRGRTRTARTEPPRADPSQLKPSQVSLETCSEDDSAFSVSPLDAPNDWRNVGRRPQTGDELLAKFLSDMPTQVESDGQRGDLKKFLHSSRTSTSQRPSTPQAAAPRRNKTRSPPTSSSVGADHRQTTPRPRPASRSKQHHSPPLTGPPQGPLPAIRTGTPRTTTSAQPTRGQITVPPSNSPRPIVRYVDIHKAQGFHRESRDSPGSTASTATKSSSSSSPRDHEPTTPKAMKLDSQLDELMRTESHTSRSSVSSAGSRSTNKS